MVRTVQPHRARLGLRRKTNERLVTHELSFLASRKSKRWFTLKTGRENVNDIVFVQLCILTSFSLLRFSHAPARPRSTGKRRCECCPEPAGSTNPNTPAAWQVEARERMDFVTSYMEFRQLGTPLRKQVLKYLTFQATPPLSTPTHPSGHSSLVRFHVSRSLSLPIPSPVRS